MITYHVKTWDRPARWFRIYNFGKEVLYTYKAYNGFDIARLNSIAIQMILNI